MTQKTQPTVPTVPDLLYTTDVATLLKVSPSTVRRLVDADKLKPVARGRGTAGLVFARADVEAYLAQAS